MESASILDGIRIDDLDLEIASPPLAQGLVGEISLLDTPAPQNGFAEVPAGKFVPFAYDLRANLSNADLGFDALQIFTSTTPRFEKLLIGPNENNLDEVEPDSLKATADGLTLFFPSNRITSTTSLRVIFDAQLLGQSTFFNGQIFAIQSKELPQPVLPANANQQVTTDNLQVPTSRQEP